MMNQLVLVGRLSNDIKKGKIEGKEVIQISVTVPRSFKNADGEYENDVIPIILASNISNNVLEYCKKGDVIGVKGHIQASASSGKVFLYGDKITFLSSGAKVDDDE